MRALTGGQPQGHHDQRTQPGRAGPGAAQRGRPDGRVHPPPRARGRRWPATAAESGVDLVVTLGGDGTVNEAVNGLMTAGPAPADTGPRRLPALAVVPGGSTNVFARALGLPKRLGRGHQRDPGGAARPAGSRTIGLGRADDRYFTFCAGLGLDAAVVRRVEQARLRGPVVHARRCTSARRSASSSPGRTARHPPITLERPGEDGRGRAGHRDRAEHRTVDLPRRPPDQPQPGRLVRHRARRAWRCGQLHVPSTARTVTQILSRQAGPARAAGAAAARRRRSSPLVSSRPQAFQLDGDYLGEREKVRFIVRPRGATRNLLRTGTPGRAALTIALQTHVTKCRQCGRGPYYIDTELSAARVRASTAKPDKRGRELAHPPGLFSERPP